jgi:L-fuconolactonase
MLRIDSHQHFWKYDAVNYDWINEEMSLLRKDFSPIDLKPILDENGIDGCVAVQAQQSQVENDFLLEYAGKYDFIKGVVGWVDLQSEKIEEQLLHYQQFKKLKGFRHVLQGEPVRDLMLKPEFKRGISYLNKYGFTYDILIFPDQLNFCRELVKELQEQPFVIDHIAKPYIRDKKIEEWQNDITAIAQYENVYCKISGMVTEADWKAWKKEDFAPYLDVVVNAFGTNRIMFGSDWPVCLVGGSYKEILSIVRDYFSSFSKQEQDAFFGGNASKFYNLDN